MRERRFICVLTKSVLKHADVVPVFSLCHLTDNELTRGTFVPSTLCSPCCISFVETPAEHGFLKTGLLGRRRCSDSLHSNSNSHVRGHKNRSLVHRLLRFHPEQLIFGWKICSHASLYKLSLITRLTKSDQTETNCAGLSES